MTTKGSVPEFKTLKECLQFLEWLNSHKQGQPLQSRVANRLFRLLKERYIGVNQSNIENALSTYLSRVSKFHKKLCQNARGHYRGNQSPKDVLYALLECIPKFLAVINFLRYNVDPNFVALGGGGWAAEQFGYGAVMRNNWASGKSKIDPYLYEMRSNKYGVIPGGFAINDVQASYRGGYNPGSNMVTDLSMILDKHFSGYNYFLDVFATSVFGKHGADMSNVANALRLVQDFCGIFGEVKDEDDFKRNLQDRYHCINWEQLKAHCIRLKEPLGKIFKGDRFSFTGYARQYQYLNQENIAKKMAKWFKKHLEEVKKKLNVIQAFDTKTFPLNGRLFQNTAVLPPKYPDAFTAYFTKNFLPYGFTLYGNQYKVNTTPYGELFKSWKGAIHELKQMNGGLDELVEILNGTQCASRKQDKKSEKKPRPKSDAVPQNDPEPERKPGPESDSGPEPRAEPEPELELELELEPEPELEPENEDDIESEPDSDEELLKDMSDEEELAAQKTEATKTEASKPPAPKVYESPNQGKKAEGAQNQGKKAEGTSNQNNGQSEPKPSSAQPSIPESPGAPGPSGGPGTSGQAGSSDAGQEGQPGQTAGNKASASQESGPGGSGSGVGERPGEKAKDAVEPTNVKKLCPNNFPLVKNIYGYDVCYRKPPPPPPRIFGEKTLTDILQEVQQRLDDDKKRQADQEQLERQMQLYGLPSMNGYEVQSVDEVLLDGEAVPNETLDNRKNEWEEGLLKEEERNAYMTLIRHEKEKGLREAERKLNESQSKINTDAKAEADKIKFREALQRSQPELTVLTDISTHFAPRDILMAYPIKPPKLPRPPKTSSSSSLMPSLRGRPVSDHKFIPSSLYNPPIGEPVVPLPHSTKPYSLTPSRQGHDLTAEPIGFISGTEIPPQTIPTAEIPVDLGSLNPSVLEPNGTSVLAAQHGLGATQPTATVTLDNQIMTKLTGVNSVPIDNKPNQMAYQVPDALNIQMYSTSQPKGAPISNSLQTAKQHSIKVKRANFEFSKYKDVQKRHQEHEDQKIRNEFEIGSKESDQYKKAAEQMKLGDGVEESIINPKLPPAVLPDVLIYSDIKPYIPPPVIDVRSFESTKSNQMYDHEQLPTDISDTKSIHDLQIDVPKRAVQDPSYDLDLDDLYSDADDILKDEYITSDKPYGDDKGFSGVPQSNFDLRFLPGSPGLADYEDPGMPRDAPTKADERVINPFSTDECLNPWSVDSSSTNTTRPPSSPHPASDHLPPPKTVREMLHWFVGLNQHGLIGKIAYHVEIIFKDFKSDAIEVTGDRSQLIASHVTNTLTEACVYSASVLFGIKHRDDYRTYKDFNFKSVYSQLRYSLDPAALLCQLRDYVYACHHQLAFLKSQCKRDKLSGGWQNCEYGSDISSPNSPLQAFLTDGWDCPFKTHLFDPCNPCLKSRVRMGFRKGDLPKTLQLGSVISAILSPTCGGSDHDALLGTKW